MKRPGAVPNGQPAAITTVATVSCFLQFLTCLAMFTSFGNSRSNLRKTTESHYATFFRHENSLFRHNRFPFLFSSMKVAKSGKIVLVIQMIDFKDIQV
jgi:hypothetical protein